MRVKEVAFPDGVDAEEGVGSEAMLRVWVGDGGDDADDDAGDAVWDLVEEVLRVMEVQQGRLGDALQ